jgi:hypothetical protein
MGVKVLIAGDLVGWEDSTGHDQISCGTPVKPIGRDSSELYTLAVFSFACVILAYRLRHVDIIANRVVMEYAPAKSRRIA